MFYRVIVLEQDDNKRSLLLKADEKMNLSTTASTVADFLFPGEDTSEYETCLTPMLIGVGKSKLMYFRVTAIRPSTSSDTEEFPPEYEIVLEADSEKEAENKALADAYKGYPGKKLEAFAEQVSVKELIAEEENYLRNRIRQDYLLEMRGEVSLKELCDWRQGEEKNEEEYYRAVRFFLNKMRMRNALERSIDLEKISAAEYNTLISRLPLANDRAAFEIILNEAKEKYGKVVNE